MVTGIKNSTVVVMILIEDTKRHKRRTQMGPQLQILIKGK